MELKLTRLKVTDKATEGRLYVNGEFECFTLEDVDRNLESGGTKIDNKTAIPKGKYEVTITFSNHFQKLLPLLIGVPNYEGVRIHSGNTDADTEGCILVGSINDKLDDDYIGASRKAFDHLYPKIKNALSMGEKVTLEIV